ncbi:hypothetical protein BX265_6951 [Streptomyces sp. TLI_235]|nr:hypothetical protein [Streptomyces sp. TLI_235]PBC69619.1 hypothetical protein BX265_6951 [Streptomyces sp. TLI_235]
MSAHGTALAPSSALASVGLPDPGGDPGALRDAAQAHRDLAAQLRAHSAYVDDLVLRSQPVWQGSAADAFRVGATSHAVDLSNAATVVDRAAEGHEEHASRLHYALEVLEELAIQIGATLAFMAAAAAFPPLLAAAELQLAALAVEGGRIIQWLSDLLAAIVRFFVKARAWIAQFTKLVWRGESFSFGYGKLVFDGMRDATVDVLANLTARGIAHRQLDITMLWSAIGSGLAGGMLGGLEASGFKKVLTEAGEVKRATDGLPEFVSMGEQAKSWVRSLKKAPARDTARAARTDALGASAEATAVGTPRNAPSRVSSDLEGLTRINSAADTGRISAHTGSRPHAVPPRRGLDPAGADGAVKDLVPTSDDIARALGGSTQAPRITGVRFLDEAPSGVRPTPTKTADAASAVKKPGVKEVAHGRDLPQVFADRPLDRYLIARAGARKAGLRGLPSEGEPLARDVMAAGAAQRGAATAHQDAELALQAARRRLAAAERHVAARTEELGRDRARVWAAESRHDIARVLGDPAQARQIEQEVVRARAGEAHSAQNLHAALSTRDAAASEVRSAARTTDTAATAADTAQTRLRAATVRQEVWQEFADAGKTVRQASSAPTLFSDALRHSAWKEGYPVEYTPSVHGGGHRSGPQRGRRPMSGGSPSSR